MKRKNTKQETEARSCCLAVDTGKSYGTLQKEKELVHIPAAITPCQGQQEHVPQ